MRKFKIVSAIIIVAIFALSCSDGGGDNKPNKSKSVSKEKISGVSQKGPFVKGSQIIVWELDESLVKTGDKYEGATKDDMGSWEIKDLKLESRYVMVEVIGKYKNEMTGEISASNASLTAIVDVMEKDNININVLTTLESERIIKLVEDGKTFLKAKEQAQKEVLNELGMGSYTGLSDSEDMSIFGDSQSNAMLLALSVLLLNSSNDITALLNEISDAIKELGKWNNEETKAEMASGLSQSEIDNIRIILQEWDPDAKIGNFENVIEKAEENILSSSSIETSSSSSSNPSSSSEDCGSTINSAYLECANWTLGEADKETQYTVSAMLNVPNEKTLKILPGATITFNQASAGITVANGGKLVAEGTEQDSIVFKGSAQKWQGITINSPLDNTLSYVQILNAGSGTAAYSASLYIIGAVSLSNSLIDGSASNGISTEGSGYLLALENTAIRNSNKAPIYTYSALLSLRNIGEGNTFEGNTNNYIHGSGVGSITENMSIKKLDVPWRIYGNLKVSQEAVLTVEPGVIIEFGNSNSGISVDDNNGNPGIVMEGTPQDSITLRGIANSKGSWNNIDIRSNNEVNSLRYVNILNGGSGTNTYSSSLYVYGGSISVKHSKIDGSASNGICTEGTGTVGYFTAFDSNTVSNSGKDALYAYSSIYSMRNFGNNNVFTDNASNRANVPDSYVNNMTIKNIGIPYYLRNGLNIAENVDVEIEPGTQISVDNSKRITVEGNLKAIGTASERIVFKGSSEQAGWWDGIIVRTKTVGGTVFEYVDIAHGGRGTSSQGNSCLNIWNAYITLKYVELSQSEKYGISLEGCNHITWDNVSFDDIGNANVWLHNTGDTMYESLDECAQTGSQLCGS